MFEKKSKGFSVFTPMVGTLVLMITFLIVASMLESEKWNFMGLFETYQTIQVTGVSHEAQDRMVAVVRDTILTDLEQRFSVYVDQCMSPELTDKKYRFSKWYNIQDKFGKCEEKVLNNTRNQAIARLTGVGLSTSYVKALLERITSKYELVKVQSNLCMDCKCTDERSGQCLKKECIVYRNVDGKNTKMREILEKRNNIWKLEECEDEKGNKKDKSLCGSPCVDPTSTIESVEIIDCDVDDCKDGRLNVSLDFTRVKSMPIATIKANQSQYTEMNIYLPEHKENFITNDPIAFYALETAKLFENFTLLDKTWHYAGGYDHDEYGNGSEWYHYSYAVQARIPGSESDPDATNASMSFWFSVKDKPIDLSDENSKWGGLLTGSNLNGNLRIDRLLPSSTSYTSSISSSHKMDWKYLLYFLAGWSRKSDSYFGNYDSSVFSWLENHFSKATSSGLSIFPGGCVSSGLCGWGNGLAGITNKIKLPASISMNLNNGTGTILKEYTYAFTSFSKPDFKIIDTVTDYDKKFFNDLTRKSDGKLERTDGNLENAVESILNHIASNPTLKASAGYAEGDKIAVNLTVESEQIYSCGEMEGGDNWHCGQWMAMYVPIIAGHDVEALIKDYGKSAIFLSLPYNYSCYTCVMHKVRETYTVHRNAHNEEEPNNTVFRITFTRWKEDYNADKRKLGTDESTFLWKGTDVKDSTYEVGGNIRVRKCTYYCVAESSGSSSPTYSSVSTSCDYKCNWDGEVRPYSLLGLSAP